MKEDEAVKLLETSSFFDAQWYKSCYPDVEISGMDSAMHFLKYGWRMGRDPSPNFSTLDYLKMHQDVKKNGINPLLHYLNTGKSEKRQIRPTRIRFNNTFSGNPQASKPAGEGLVVNDNKTSVNLQLSHTQELLEFYYQRCQELEYKLLER